MRKLSTLFSIGLAAICMNVCVAKEAVVWIGMAPPKGGEKEGIYRATLDMETGALSKPELAAAIGTPEFLAIRPDGKRLYAACKLESGDAGVAAFEISDDKQRLKLLNTQPTNTDGACHLATDREGKCLYTAQYGAGTVAAFSLDAEGNVQSRSGLVKHDDVTQKNSRQDGPHPHWVGTDPGNKFLFVPDLGNDQIVIYAMDLDAGTITPHGHGDSPAGSGPRHMVFHPNGKFAYVVNELAVSVTAFAYDAEAGTLTEIETVDSMPEGDRGDENTAAEICIRPDGKYLYASTRGRDTVTAFAVDSETGKLTYVGQESVRGRHPRSVELDPSGKWLLAAGRDTNTIAVLRVDEKTGGLEYSGKSVSSPAPICIVMQEME
jgi:6-phosphogluconolactonase